MTDQVAHPRAKLAVLISGNVLMTFMISAVMPASGAIARHFSGLGNTALHAQIALLAPSFALIFAAPVSGLLIRNYGRRGPLLAGLAFYALAGGAELFISGFWPLVAARICLGAAGGAITTICMTLAGDYFSGARREWAVALVGMAPAPGSVAVLLLSGVLVDWGGWHMAFLPYLAAVPVLFAAWFTIQEPARPPELAAAGSTLPPKFWRLCAITMLEACIAVLPAVQLPFLLIAIGARGATAASVVIALSACVAVATGGSYPLLRKRLSVDHILVTIFAVAALSYAGLALAQNIVLIVIFMLFAGFPVGLMIPHFSSVTIERASAEARGRAVGLITSSIFLGQVCIPFVAEPLRAALGLRGMFGALAVALVAAGVCATALPKPRAAKALS